jgi:hypothetical protein
VDSVRIVRVGKKLVAQLAAKAQNQIDRGDVHENQGFELEPKLNDWFQAYDRYLTYQERCEVKDYFWERMKTLDYKRQGINVPAKNWSPT